MQWRVGEHDAQLRIAGRDGRGNLGIWRGASLQQQDRRLRRREHAGLYLRNLAMPANFIERGEHQREGPIGTPLSLPQYIDRVGLRGIDQQLKAAEPLHGHDTPLQEARTAASKAAGPAASCCPGRLALQGRPAARTRDRLGVKTPIGRIDIFRLALWAQGELGHRGSRPIVGQLPNDRPARPAVGAVGEGIAVAALGRIANFGKTKIAGGQVGGNGRLRRRRGRAGANGECRRSFAFFRAELPAGDLADFDAIDAGLWRVGVAQAVEEAVQRGPLAFDLDLDHARGVLHPALQVMLASGMIDERPEPDSLDHPAHGNRQTAFDRGRRRQRLHKDSVTQRPGQG